jgi:hypothetical protein
MSTPLRGTLLLLIAVLAVTLAAAASPRPAAAATALNGRCGMHIGKLLRRDSGGSTYRFRIGPKYLGTLRPGTCRGKVRIRVHGRTGVFGWHAFQLTNWNLHTTLVIKSAITVVGCTTVGTSVKTAITAAATAGTDGLAYPVAVAAASAGGCGYGALDLWSLLPDGPDTLDGVRMVK